MGLGLKLVMVIMPVGLAKMLMAQWGGKEIHTLQGVF